MARIMTYVLLLLVSALIATPSWALTPLSDSDLSEHTAQSGIAISLSAGVGENVITADSVNVVYDSETPALEATHRITDVALYSHDGGAFKIDTQIDVGSDSGDPGVSIFLDWRNLTNPAEIPLTDQSAWASRRDLVLDFGGGAVLPGNALGVTSNSWGRMGLVGAGYFRLVNQGLLNIAYDDASLELKTIGNWFYSQAAGTALAPELSFGNLDFSYAFVKGANTSLGLGTVGLSSNGFVATAPYIDLTLNFDLLYKGSPSRIYDTTGRGEMILFGWAGGVTGIDEDEDGTFERNGGVTISAGGYGYGEETIAGSQFNDYDGSGLTARSQGLNVLAEWDYDSDFAWLLGQAGGNRTTIRFFDWKRLSGAPHDFRIPLIVDVFTQANPAAGICFGGVLPASGNLTSGACAGAGGASESLALDSSSALGVLIRDAGLHAYNSQVEVIDPGAAIESEIFNWSLLYTYGKLDANVMLYPEGISWNGSAYQTTTTGLKADVLVTAQSPGYWAAAQSAFSSNGSVRDNWATHTHFGIADTLTSEAFPTPSGGTSSAYAFGLLNADLIWKANDLYFRVTEPDGAYADFPGGLWVQTSVGSKFGFRGALGAGSLDDLSRTINISLLDVNLDTDNFIFALSPGNASANPGETFIAFDGRLDFSGDAYISLAEPSQPAADLRLGNVDGTIRWRDGRIQVLSSSATADNRPALVIANKIDIGRSVVAGQAGPTAGTDLTGTFTFSGAPWLHTAIPGGTWESRISIKKQ
ncbi:hypothetical protein [Alcanivorax sp. 1008]|uniref:hypothetical protein n=1 Tax=Alcanivorax sp. 1008 TaxID=2816853 RepID=UPI001DF464C6|nr:hypothetical protein [Alcanivorax sp. 1008]MCC1497086.1 hypothetical protein [Alcanivorax sp. 1008]